MTSTATGTGKAEVATPPRVRPRSMREDRRRALIWSYFFLALFVIFFLTPPIYMLITSLKSNAEISRGSVPWWTLQPTLENYAELLSSGTYLVFFRNSAVVSRPAETRWRIRPRTCSRCPSERCRTSRCSSRRASCT